MKKKYILALVIFMLLPLFFPCGGRGYTIFPFTDLFFDTTDGTFYWWPVFISIFLSLPYWAFVGYMFRRFGVAPLKSFLLGNIPVFFNVVAETVYYYLLGYIHRDYSEVIAYLIGAHIDKFQFPGADTLPTVFFSAAAFLLSFEVGYHLQTIGGFLSCQKTS